MPSVRIVDSTFLQTVRVESPLPAEPQSSSQDDTEQPMSPQRFLPRMRTMPTLRHHRSSSTSSQRRPQRSRSGSTTSRVHDHIMRSSSRYTLSPDPQTSSTSALPLLSDEEEESQGPLSTSAASHTNADSIRATYGSELEVHHDDVIEHLDVIGECYTSTSLCPHEFVSS